MPPDKFSDKSFTLRDYIFSDNKPKTDLALKILSNRSSHFNMEKLKKDDFPRWKAIAKELYDDIYNR